MHQEDAMKHIVTWIRDGERTERSNYGYDLYIPNVIRAYLASIQIRDNQQEGYQLLHQLAPVFFDAGWELCRRGIIRPGIRNIGEQATPDGSAGSGFCITPFGRRWIEESGQDIFVPTEPERFAQMIEPFRLRFGLGFHARAQEAVRCYGAHAYLACCTMCGAATESILLATAIAKVGDEEQVLKMYARASGRKDVENTLIGKAREPLQREFRGFTNLLKYWRDEAAHGIASTIADNEAYTAIAMLLRYAMFVNASWSELTAHHT
jgi:hypothetical protein